MFYLNLMSTKDGARGLCFMPKRGLDISKNEIARWVSRTLSSKNEKLFDWT